MNPDLENQNDNTQCRPPQGPGCIGCLVRLFVFLLILAVVGVLAVVGLLKLAAAGNRRHAAQREAEARQSMKETLRSVKKFDKAGQISLYAPGQIDEIFLDKECVPKIDDIVISMADLSGDDCLRLKNLPNLRKIHFYDCWNSDPFLKSLRGKESIEELSFDCTYASDFGMAQIATLPNLKRLSDPGIVTNAGLEHFRSHPSLETIIVINPKITDNDLAVLATLPKLRHLSIEYDERHGPTITDAALEHFKKLTNLETLIVIGSRLSKDAARDLQKALPKCKITTTVALTN